MLVFAAFVPHPLISLPDLGKGHTARVRHTLKSYKELASELYAAKPDIIVTLSSHGATVAGVFAIHQSPTVEVSFAQLGNLSDRATFKNHLGFGYRLKESMEATGHVALTGESPIDYGTGVTLFHLTRNLSDTIRVVPIGVPTVSPTEAFEFGKALGRQVQRVTDRIALIATGDLSHGATRGSVAGYNPKAFAFNKMIRNALEQSDVRALLSLTQSDLASVAECGIRPFAVLTGALGERRYRIKVLSYEAALGVGYLAARFDLH